MARGLLSHKTVTIEHPDLPDQPAEVPEMALPHWERAGWQKVEEAAEKVVEEVKEAVEALKPGAKKPTPDANKPSGQAADAAAK